jgi:hypothetical protein
VSFIWLKMAVLVVMFHRERMRGRVVVWVGCFLESRKVTTHCAVENSVESILKT